MFASVSARGPTHACGVTGAGDGYCWGSNQYGKLGTAQATNSLVPARVAGGLKWAVLSVGFNHTCGITRAGVAHCWGYGGAGRLGTGRADDEAVPAEVMVPAELR